jgi:murein DD-endopeptidase MepM/ murein hydrolase activator NlpD
MTASNDRRSPRRRARRWRFLQLLLGVFLLSPGLALQVPAVPVRADDLSDAVAEQKRLAALIANQKAQLAGLTGQQAALKTRIGATQQGLTGVSSSLDDVQAQVTALQGQLERAKAQFDGLAAQQVLLETRLAQLTNEQDAKQRELDVRQQILASRLVASYETDQTPVLQQILTAHSLTDALSDASYYSSLSQADKVLADQIEQDQETLAEVRQSVEMASAANGAMEDQVAAERQQLADEQAQVTATQTHLDALKATFETELAAQQAAAAKLERNQAALAAAVQSNGAALDQLGSRIDRMIRQQAGKGQIPSIYNGLLRWPMSGVITQRFGCTGDPMEPPKGSCAHYHNGIDIAAPCYTPVYAAGAGVVVFVGYNPYDAPPKAWIVIIAHSTNLVTWYGHMTPKAPHGIRVGARVAAGQLVGTENTTGHSTGCHLHWAVRVGGIFMNPRLFV